MTGTRPPGFTADQLTEFLREGFLVLPEVMDAQEVERWLGHVDDLVARAPHPDPQATQKYTDIVPRDPAFEPLIDLPTHLGFVYDLYGEQLRLSQSEVVVRPRGGKANSWHVDGPRAVPFAEYSEVLPLKTKVGYWLTDLPRDRMGNLVVVPGSHRRSWQTTLAGNDEVRGQRVVLCPPGTMTLMHAGIWHRVEPNVSSTTRRTLFVSYGPSWVTAYQPADPVWAAGLTRRRRVIMRPYEDWEDYIRPPAEDLDLFELGDARRSPSDTVEPESHKRRRPLAVESLADR